MHPVFYRPSFYRHLRHLAASEFYARELDADDHAFLETVRMNGIANGTLPRTDTVLIDELDFWHLPYAIAPDIVRRAGPVAKRIPETPEERALRAEKSNAWHARRALRGHERAIAAAEMERERHEWEKANAERKLREALSDVEWDAAAPWNNKKRRFGKIVKGHYVPQWKLDEEREAAKAAQATAAEARKAAKKAAAGAKQARARTIEIEKARAEAAQTVKRLDRLTLTHRQRAEGVPDTDILKEAILQMIRNSHPHVWSVEELMRSIGYFTPEVMDACLKELVREGKLRAVMK